MNPTHAEFLAAMPQVSKVLLQFNKQTGAHTATLGWVEPSTLNNVYYDYATVEGFDAANDEVVGLYPNHTIVKLAPGHRKVYEGDIDQATFATISERYPLVEQLNLMRDLLLSLGRQRQWTGGSQDPTFMTAFNPVLAMDKHIKECLLTGKNDKLAMQEDPTVTYLSNAELVERQQAQEAGGLGALHQRSGLSSDSE